MTIATDDRTLDTIRTAWARGMDTITRQDGESAPDFTSRACRESGGESVVRLATARGDVVAKCHAGDLYPADQADWLITLMG